VVRTREPRVVDPDSVRIRRVRKAFGIESLEMLGSILGY
jgi:hypothetical protein